MFTSSTTHDDNFIDPKNYEKTTDDSIPGLPSLDSVADSLPLPSDVEQVYDGNIETIIPDTFENQVTQSQPKRDSYDEPKEGYETDIDNIISRLPESLQDCVSVFKTPAERYMALYTAITVTGPLMPHVTVLYDNSYSYVNLMLSIIFPPASGKGSLTQIRKLLAKINDHLIAGYKQACQKYESDLDVYKQSVKKGTALLKPSRPPMLMMLLPGNTSSAQIMSTLADCSPDNMIAIFETEMDAYGVTATKSDFGSLNSTILRQAFHNEPISLLRKTNAEHTSIELPKMTAVFIGTPSQTGRVLSIYDGTLTRFLIVMGNSPVVWKDIKPCKGCRNLDHHFATLSEKWFEMWKILVKTRVEVKISDLQYDRINEFGKKHLALIHHFTGEQASGIAQRHGIMIVRIAAILTMVRYYEKKCTSQTIECEDRDFDTALWMVSHSITCSQALFKALPRQKGENEDLAPGNKLKFLQWFPDAFKIAEAKNKGKEMKLSERTVSRWLTEFVNSEYLERVGHGEYRKTPLAALALSSLSAKE